MAGPPKPRMQAEKQPNSSSDGSSSASRNPQRSMTKSIPRLDGNRDPSTKIAIDYTQPNDLKNLSEFLGMAGWYAARGMKIPESLPQRPKNFNQYGKAATVTINTFNVLQMPKAVVYQYDVAYAGDAADYSKRVLLKKIWNSPKVKAELGEPNNLWIWDGNKLAWSTARFERPETRVAIDLDEEEGRPTKPGARGNKHIIYIRRTRQVDFASMTAFLNGQIGWDNTCIDTINFLDHVLREWPSQQYTQIKKSFFQRGEQRFDLGGGVEAFKGVFASFRPVLDDKFKKNLSINVDVANGTFWRAQELTRAIAQVFNCTPPQFSAMFKAALKDWNKSLLKRDLRKFKKVGVSTLHTKEPTQWTIDEFVPLDATQATFPDPDNREKKISVARYFKKKYNVDCIANVPVVKMTKKIRKEAVYMPIDVLKIDGNQRYNTKLSDVQTSQMIKFAVTLPKERWAAVQHGLRLLNWTNDPYLKHYDVKVSSTPAKVTARILPSPTVSFGAGSKEMTIKPADMLMGRWRLDARKFAVTNKDKPIKAWGICAIQGRGSPSPPAVLAFIEKFIQIYESHGGVILSHPEHGKKPWLGPGNLGDGGEMVQKAWNQTGNKYNQPPNFMFFIVNDRNVEVYRRIKKSCDIRFGVASQCLQAKHVLSASPQYISNVCMKVNAKLGGCTSVAKSQLIPKIAPKSASIPTMVVGADVSHPAPGAASGEAASFAAITVSADAYFVKYWAECNTNGNRVEMVTTTNIYEHFGNMARVWMQRIGQGRAPQRVLYIRDGVSEGQYAQVLSDEVHDMKETFRRAGCKILPKFTVVIAGKRHHIRFFPEKGDRNGNPLPGTLVESGCTHPFEFDFYLCSHVAIKGTARPIHYQCILNEGEWQAAELQQFIFEHSYHYVRSTTPVSLHPAVYYAHLAADRSRAHLNESPVSSGKKESKAEQKPATGSTGYRAVEIAPLMPLMNVRGLKDVMWYV
ncbi:eukaryotic translation initiation factor 2C 2 [Pyrenophora tritici-repentis]|uniref:Piwi domain containing protein n=1 Tax=Pyrenophora tritici-repentis TaxID=45151 RepID=A0A2W1F3C1_9PLEO|nr:Piwi multi-domain protein [Pyrenophora tritici-repentis]KAF7445119.1 Piwi multi-domain protein [Pyrenophora tritici-repentis]KAF7565387.1 Piwi multi-domain protein [Pyrenophora tritici-repentis]KAG9380475.1 Piwi multi-domain protein [Pyrenophora tritici-repentis]KAI0582665.1 Piwi multi-domain protein [Pyrenophora tritici-repentis]